MMSDWGAVLQQAGATIADGAVLHFGHPEEERRSAGGELIADLSQLGLIRLSGEEAASFLQGQITADVRRVTASGSHQGAYCTPKGRVLAAFRLFSRDGDLYMRLPAPLAEPIAARLRKFILRSKVAVDQPNDLVGIGLAGTQAALWLSNRLATPMPEELGGVTHGDGLTVIRVPGDTPRFELYGPVAAIRSLWSERPAWLHPVGTPVWQLLEIRAGLPHVYPDTAELFVPQMLNLQLQGGISFEKGCYTGQEIVARMQYLGKLKRRAYLAHVDDDAVPVPGTELFAAGSESGQGPGNVIEAQRSPEGGVELLAVIERAAVDGHEEIRLYNGFGPKLSIRTLPYPFPADA